MNAELFHSTKRSTMGDEVFSQFIELFRSRVYKPGDKLPSELEMCEQLQVSRPVLREVIRALRYMGYIKSVQGSGNYVCEPLNSAISELKMKLALDKVQLMSVWELRYVLEVAMAGMAAERATDEELVGIWKAYEAYELSVKNNNDDETIAATQSFHNCVAQAVHNDVLMDMLDHVFNLLSMSRKVSIQVEGSNDRAVEFHRKIAKAIVDRDSKRAESEMREHILDVKQDLLISLERMDRQLLEAEQKGTRKSAESLSKE